MAELTRIPDVSVDPNYKTKCVKCGTEITLWFNGGELDSHICCGLIYSLASEKIDFVIREFED